MTEKKTSYFLRYISPYSEKWDKRGLFRVLKTRMSYAFYASRISFKNFFQRVQISNILKIFEKNMALTKKSI